jgi:hypothetical protein
MPSTVLAPALLARSAAHCARLLDGACCCAWPRTALRSVRGPCPQAVSAVWASCAGVETRAVVPWAFRIAPPSPPVSGCWPAAPCCPGGGAGASLSTSAWSSRAARASCRIRSTSRFPGFVRSIAVISPCSILASARRTPSTTSRTGSLSICPAARPALLRRSFRAQSSAVAGGIGPNGGRICPCARSSPSAAALTASLAVIPPSTSASPMASFSSGVHLV